MFGQHTFRNLLVLLGSLMVIASPSATAQIVSGIPAPPRSPTGDEVLRPPTPIDISETPTQSGHRYAVLVGIGNYRGTKGLDPLHADDDTEKLAALLRQQGWTVWLMNSFAPDDKQPYGANILGALGISLDGGGPSYGAATAPFLGAGALTRDDSLLFYYGGHGVQGETDGIDYIIPRDVKLSTTGELLKRTLINLKFVLTALNKTGAGNIIVFTDTCRTTARTRSANTRKAWKTRGLTGAFTEDPGPAPLQYKRHFFFESSASDEESSYEMDEQSSGVFTYFLRQAMTQGQSSSGGCTTLARVAERARSGTINYVQQKLQAAQTPTVLADTSWAESFCVQGTPAGAGDAYDALRTVLADAWKNRVDFPDGWAQSVLTQLDNCVLSWKRQSHSQSGQDTQDGVVILQVSFTKAASQNIYIYHDHELDKWAVAVRDPGRQALSKSSSSTTTGPMLPTPFVSNFPMKPGYIGFDIAIGAEKDANRAAVLIQHLIDSCHQP